MPTTPEPQDAWVLVPCEEIAPMVAFFVDHLRMRLLRISPADDPREADLIGRGLRLRLRREAQTRPIHLVVQGRPIGTGTATELQAPNGLKVVFEDESDEYELPANQPELLVSRAAAPGAWGVGRAGMQYRDLIPGRFGGRFIASHIRIPDGGPVPDNVHHHAIRVQLIHCVRGWVRLVYEDQGGPFVLRAGECVLQPPHIRHRVLESSDGLEVVELACPAEHDTLLDHTLELPTGREEPDRDFGGQRFVYAQASSARWTPLTGTGLQRRGLGLGRATGNLARAGLLAPQGVGPWESPWTHQGELLFGFVVTGTWEILGAGPEPVHLSEGDSIALPPDLASTLRCLEENAQLLEVRIGNSE